MGWLQIDIVPRAASREEFATLAGGWLTATREELAMLAPHVDFSFADSGYNEAELVGVGYKQTLVCPILVDLDKYHLPPDPAALDRWVHEHLRRADANVARLLAVKGARTVANTLRPYDEAVNGATKEERAIARTNVLQAQASVDTIKADVDELTVKAPIAAQVYQIGAELGEYVSPGVPLLSLYDLNDVYLRFNLREDLVKRIKVGDEVTMRAPALGDRPITAKIRLIVPRGEYAGWRATRATGDFDLRTFEVRAYPSPSIPELRPCMSVYVTVPGLDRFHDKGSAYRYVMVGPAGTWAVLTTIDGRDLYRLQLIGADLSGRGEDEIIRVLHRCVGVHHAGMLPKYRRAVEALFERKLLAVAVCTETLAAGINLPARSVVLTSLVKGPFGKERLIEPSIAHQIFGRAGRPQFDDRG